MDWAKGGIVGESRFIKLLYSRPAGVLLAQFERDLPSVGFVRSLYMRPVDGDEYRRVFGGDDALTAHDVVLRTTSGAAFFSVWRLLAVPNIRPSAAPGVGLDIESVARIDLRTGEVATAIEMKAYREKNDGWISAILDVEDDDRTLLCRTASRRAPDGHPTGGFGYWLSRVDMTTLEVEHISYLRHVGC